MTDLRALLGDRYDEVLTKATKRALFNYPNLPISIVEHEALAAQALAAVLPDLLAEANARADGQPIVRTVGDLTARHIGKRVWVGGGRDLQLDVITHRRRDVKLDVSDGPRSSGWLICEHDTPCEVLP